MADDSMSSSAAGNPATPRWAWLAFAMVVAAATCAAAAWQSALPASRYVLAGAATGLGAGLAYGWLVRRGRERALGVFLLVMSSATVAHLVGASDLRRVGDAPLFAYHGAFFLVLLPVLAMAYRRHGRAIEDTLPAPKESER